MANKRINDLPEETDPASTDVVAVDGATTRKATRANFLGANLEAVRGLTSAADKGIQFTGSGTAATYDLTAAGKALLDDADASAQRTTLGLVIGTDVQAYDADLAALAANSTDGLWAHTGAGTGAARTLTAPAAGITVSNGNGVSGNPTLALANDLSALEGLSGTGIARRTGSDAWSVGTTVSNAELSDMTAYTFKMNATGSSAAPTDVEISTLTTKASPASGDYILISDQAASGAVKKATVSSVAAAGSVASLNGQTGALTSYYAPQGRLTLATGVPVMTSTQSAKTTLYYTPYVGDKVPIYDGTNMVPTTFSELSIATTDTTKNPAAIGASKVNDWFVWNDGGTLRLSHGPDWTNDTTRGYSLALVNGIYLNNSAITNGPGASRGTYVGTTRSNGSSQLDWIFGASGTAPFFGVWNTYNRVVVSTTWNEGTASWSYNSATVRALNNTAIARASFVRGLAEDGVTVIAQTYTDTNSGAAAAFGWGLDSTSSNTTQMQATAPSAAGIGSVQYAGLPGSGFHYLQQTEKSSGAVSYTAYGGSTLSSITFSGRM